MPAPRPCQNVTSLKLEKISAVRQITRKNKNNNAFGNPCIQSLLPHYPLTVPQSYAPLPIAQLCGCNKGKGELLCQFLQFCYN